MIVLDTAVLVYAVGVEHRWRDPSRRLVAAITDGRIAATTTVDVIQEFAHVFARRRDRGAAVTAARRYATLLAPLLVSTPDELEEGLKLYSRYSGLGVFDALLAATAIRAEAEAFVSADGGFAAVPRLPFVGLGSAEFERLLAA